MKVVVLGGAGMMGRVAVLDLVESFGASVTIADANVEAARKLADSIGGGKVDVRPIDVNDPSALDSALDGHDCALNAVNYYHNLAVMEGCLRKRVSYVDLGGLFHMTRRQLALDAGFREAGLTAVIGVGADPGITNIQAARAARDLRTIHSVRIYDGILPSTDGAIVWGYSIATILDEVTMNPFAYRDGEFLELPPLAEPEAFIFAPPIGLRTVHHSLHSEVATMPLVYADKGIRNVSFKINDFGFTPEVLARLKVLSDLGFASTDPVKVRGVDVVPRDALVAMLSARASEADPAPVEGAEELVTVVEGADESGPVTVTLRTMNVTPRWGLDPGSVMTGIPPAIVAAWIAKGDLRAPGVHAPESVVEPDPFFRELDQRNIGTRIAVERGLGK
jgi:saccharopine dehydrogenase (NAD+, L-lysine-forming)